MAREIKILCGRCDARLGDGPYCPKCGYPTPNASHEDRVEWELRQWSAANPAATVASTPMSGLPTVEVATRTRRWFKSRNGNGKHSTAAAGGNGNGHTARAANGNGHAAPEGTNGSGNGHAEALEEISPFAPSPDAVNKPAVKTPRSKIASKRAKPMPKEAAPASDLEPKIEHREQVATPRPKTIRNAHRLPSLADIEAAAKEGPSMVKILRLIQLRAAVLEAQIDAEETG